MLPNAFHTSLDISPLSKSLPQTCPPSQVMILHYISMIKPKCPHFPLPCFWTQLYLLLCYWANACFYWRLNSPPYFSQALHTLFNCTKLYLCLTFPISNKHVCHYYSRRIPLVSYFLQDISFFIFDYRTGINPGFIPAVSTTSYHIHSSSHSGLSDLSLTHLLKSYLFQDYQ